MPALWPSMGTVGQQVYLHKDMHGIFQLCPGSIYRDFVAYRGVAVSKKPDPSSMCDDWGRKPRVKTKLQKWKIRCDRARTSEDDVSARLEIVDAEQRGLAEFTRAILGENKALWGDWEDEHALTGKLNRKIAKLKKCLVQIRAWQKQVVDVAFDAVPLAALAAVAAEPDSPLCRILRAIDRATEAGADHEQGPCQTENVKDG